MSSRQLRRLQQKWEAEKATGIVEQDSDASDDVGVPAATPKPRLNPFATLGGDEDQDDEDADEGGKGGEDEGRDVSQAESPANAATSKAQQQQQKKKKKKKKKAKAGHAPAAATESAGRHDEGEVDEDEIDRAIKELKIDTDVHKEADAPRTGECDPGARLCELLGINTHHLRAVNEMRNLFGRDVIEWANTEEQQENNRRRREAPQREVDLETFLREPPGAQKLPELLLRRNVFVQGREHWPRQPAGGLVMKPMGKSPDGCPVYAFVHEKEYDEVQRVFFGSVLSGDPMQMVYLLKRNPYHVSTLLQVSSVAKQDQNMALAAELCERALFTFGRVTTSSFRQDMEHGRARLDFARPENRQFWLAGYHYIQSLIRKGTYRTALEWAKLLYALDPTDPYAMRHFIHVMAIRAHESQWLVDFTDGVLCREGEERPDAVYLRQTLVLAKLQMDDLEGARQHLVDGLRLVPWLYCALFQELNLDTPPSIWGISPGSDARSFWVKLYIYQAKELWSNGQATALLQDVAQGLSRVDTAALAHDDAPADLAVTRLAYLEGQTSLLAGAPRELLESQPNYESDPLPPPEEDNVFTGEGTRLPWHRADQSRGAELHAQMQNLLARHGVGWAGPMGGGLAGGLLGGGDDDDDDEMRALQEADDEELRRDIEAHMGRGDEPGMLATLLQMLGVGQGGGGGGGQVGDERRDSSPDGDVDRGSDESVLGMAIPGAWPSDADAGDGSGDGETDAAGGGGPFARRHDGE